MKIGILGAGNVGGAIGIGGAIGKGWARKGVFGVRNTSDPKVVAVLKEAGVNARAASVAEAAAFSEVLVLATPWPAAQNALL